MHQQPTNVNQIFVTYTHDWTQNWGKQHEIKKDLEHVEQERCEFSHSNLSLLILLSTNSNNGNHSSKDKEVGEEVEDSVPVGLIETNLIYFVCREVVLRELLFLGGKSYDT